MTFLSLNGKMIFYPSVHWYMYCYYYILWKSKILVQFIAVNTYYMSACDIIMCLYILFIYIVYVESVLTWWWVCCFFRWRTWRCWRRFWGWCWRSSTRASPPHSTTTPTSSTPCSTRGSCSTPSKHTPRSRTSYRI